MLKKISCLLVLCMVLGLAATLASCGGDSPIATDNGLQDSNNVLDNSDTSDNTDNSTPTDTTPTDSTPADARPTDTKPVETPDVRGKKPIDIYIIAGQSNAAGHTYMDNSVLSSLWSKYNTGVSSVRYMGRAEYNNSTGTGVLANDVNWTNAKAGLGHKGTYMGPEVGMAAALSEYYTEASVANGGPAAGIIKYAHGGTSLLGKTNSENSTTGNWVSPSVAGIVGVDYTGSGLQGGLYRGMLDYVEKSITALRIEGYDDIRIKGLFWMQGESDRSEPATYEIALNSFISDVRTNLGAKIGQDLSKMPFIIGEISRTTGSADKTSTDMNAAFISMQNNFAMWPPYCYVVNSSKYDVNALVNGENQAVGSDSWHWNTSDMFHIGEEVGNCILKKILKVK